MILWQIYVASNNIHYVGLHAATLKQKYDNVFTAYFRGTIWLNRNDK